MFKIARLVRVENQRTVTDGSDPDFLYLVRQGILLSLHAEGILTLSQYRGADELLKARHLPPGPREIRGGQIP